MTPLTAWAARWSVPAAALDDLRRVLAGETGDSLSAAKPDAPRTESGAQNAIRLEASQKGILLFRNNVGALLDESGRPVRYGLANDSKAMNQVLKSADLIGVRPVTITPAHLGQTIGQFVSREVKAPGWTFTGAGREAAQMAWVKLITSVGGDACFATGPGSL